METLGIMTGIAGQKRYLGFVLTNGILALWSVCVILKHKLVVWNDKLLLFLLHK